MTHAQWTVTIKRALAIAHRDSKSALQTLRTLTRALESQLTTGVHEWHAEQTLQVTSLVQSGSGDHRASSDTLQRVAERHEQELQYHLRGLISACAAAALELAHAGDRAGAARLLRKAAPWAASLRPPDELLEQARKTVRAQSARTRSRKSAD